MQALNNSNKTLQRLYNVTELAFELKNLIEHNFSLVHLKAEISGLKIHSSGHAYFCLKDQDSVIDGVCWRGVLQTINLKLEDGLEVICIGRITTYPGRSKYQIVVQKIDLSGEGTLLKILETRKRKLADEGLFLQSRKKGIPFLPQKIGIITSLTGAVIQDIIHRIQERFPLTLIIWPVLVQGEEAANQIINAIQGFNSLPLEHNLRPDLIIVARGGGSVEDLWCFNDENLVRVVAVSQIPLISAVGHETDTTLIDYVSDYRAPTPTAAAEKAVPVRHELFNILKVTSNRLNNSYEKCIFEKQQRFDYRFEIFLKIYLNFIRFQVTRLAHIKVISPLSLLNDKKIFYNQLSFLFTKHIYSFLESLNLKLAHFNHLLEVTSYQKVLERGFVLVQNSQQKIIKCKYDIQNDRELILSFKDGQQKVIID